MNEVAGRPPSVRWTNEHGRKIVHTRWLSAAWHALVITVKFRERRVLWRPYRCRWGQWYRDGETAPAHWHVGRKPRRRAK